MLDQIPYDTTTITGALAAVASGIASIIFILRKKLAADSTDIKKLNAEENIIELLESQRDFAYNERDKALDKLEKVSKEKDEATMTIYKMTVKMENLSNQVETLKNLIKDLNFSLEETKQSVAIYAADNARLIKLLEDKSRN